MFENRYYILFVQNGYWQYIRYPFLMLNYFAGLTYCIPVYLDVPKDQEIARRKLFNKYPNACEFASDKSLVSVINFGDTAWTRLRDNALTFTLLVEIITFVVLLRVKMNRALKTSISGDTLRMQKKFIKALNIQVGNVQAKKWAELEPRVGGA